MPRSCYGRSFPSPHPTSPHPNPPVLTRAHQCRNMHWENLDKLLAIVDREFGEQGFYHAGPDGEALSFQDGVVRTNCMDCLDRTNVVQSLLARRSMLVRKLQLPGAWCILTVMATIVKNKKAQSLHKKKTSRPSKKLRRTSIVFSRCFPNRVRLVFFYRYFVVFSFFFSGSFFRYFPNRSGEGRQGLCCVSSTQCATCAEIFWGMRMSDWYVYIY